MGYGYIQDDHDKTQDPTIRALLGARLRDATSHSLEGFITELWDQGPSSSCVGFAFARGIQLRCAKLGTPIVRPSATAIYTSALAIERKLYGKPSDHLQDRGSQPYLAVQGMVEWGIPADSQWPVGGFDPDKVTDEPTLDMLQNASLFELQQYYRIDTEGSTRLDDIRRAISEGYPVVIGAQVDKAFEQYNGRGVLTAANPNELVGGHMTCLVGWTEDGLFRWINSWGNGWGDGGMFTTDEAYLTAATVNDIYALQVAAR